MTAEKIAELKRLYAQIANVPLGGIGGRIVNAFPSLIAALEAATAERDEEKEYRDSAENQRDAALYFMQRHDICDDEKLAARDARLKAEGAAEWLENAAREGGYYERSSEGMMQEAAELRKKGGV